jgi:preprotein translocase subunit Sec61beta
MSRKKKKDNAPAMPASSAGLMRFFQDEAYGLKIRPEFVLGGAILLVLSVIAAHVLL